LDGKTNDFLFCLGCNKKLSEREVASFSYIKCNDCNTVVDNNNHFYKLEILNPIIDSLDESDWGMDYIKFNPKDL